MIYRNVRIALLCVLIFIFISIIIFNRRFNLNPLLSVNVEINNTIQDVCAQGVQSNNYEKRVEFLTKCIENKNKKYCSEDYNYFFKRGYGYEMLNKPIFALKDYFKAIELNKEFEPAIYNAGNIYYAINEYNAAFYFYSKAIVKNPKNGKAYYNIGQVYKDTGEFEKAIENYDKSISLNQMKSDSYLNKGFCLNKLNRYKEALESYNKSLEENPKNYKTYNDRGYLLYQYKKYKIALEDYNKALEIDPNYIATIFNRIALYIQIAKYDSAFNDLNKIVDIDPTYSAKANYTRGYIYDKLNNYELSIDYYEKAIEENPKFTWSYNNLAIILCKENGNKYYNPDRAIELLLKANEISGPRVPAYNDSLAYAYALIGQFQKAVKYEEVALDIAKNRRWEIGIKNYQEALEAYKNNKVPNVQQMSNELGTSIRL